MASEFDAANENSELLWSKPAPLAGVKSKKRPVLSAQLQGFKGAPLALTLVSRVAVSGLSQDEVAGLLAAFEDASHRCTYSTHQEEFEKGPWSVWQHERLQVAVISAGVGGTSTKESLVEAAVARPHVLVVPSGVLASSDDESASASAMEALKGFGGAVLLIQEPGSEVGRTRLLNILGPTSEFVGAAQGRFLHRALSDLLKTELVEDGGDTGLAFVNNVQIQDQDSDDAYPFPWLAELINEKFAPLYDEEFAAVGGLKALKNLRQAQADYDVKVSFLIGNGTSGETPDLKGYVVYKVWGAPSPGISVCAIEVDSRFRGCGYGRTLMKFAESQAALAGLLAHQARGASVRLRSVASAVRFYERIGFERTDGGETLEVLPEGEKKALDATAPLATENVAKEQLAEDEPGEDPCVPMAFPCQSEESEGVLSEDAASALLPLDPWTPRRSRHLEIGPTFLPIEKLLLPDAAV